MNRPDLDAARTRARELGGARVPRHVPVSLDRAAGRVLAVDVRAGAHVPAADVAGTDGWAVCGPGPWSVVGGTGHEVDGAGPYRSTDGGSGRVDGTGPSSRPPARLLPGQASAVGAGAPLPRGAEAVVATAQARVDDGCVRGADPAVGAGVRRRGEEMAAGDVVLARGGVITPARAGLAATAGADAVHVVLAPRTVLLVTGGELTGSGSTRGDRVRDSLSHVLPALLDAMGADLQRTARAGDDRETLRDVFAGPYRSTVDLVVTTGGTAAGPTDEVRRALVDVGARLVVDGAAVRPGGTALLATVPDGPVVVALPGDPLAAVAGLLTLLAPVLGGWLGREEEVLHPVRLAPGHRAPRDPAGSRLLPATLVPGRAEVVPTGHDGPAMLRGLASADGFVVLDPDGRTRWLPMP